VGVREEADGVHPPLEISVPVHGTPLPVRLVGALQPQAAGRSLFLLNKAGVHPNQRPTEGFRLKALRAYLDHHLLAAVSDTEIPHGALGLAGRSADGKKAGFFRGTVSFAPLDPAVARARLAAWITELLEIRDPGLLPIEAVLKDEHTSPEDLRAWILDKGDDARSFAAFKTGPLRHAERFALDPDPAATAERRLGDFLRQSAAGTAEEA
ncbi:MAG: hypothetical protein KGI56_08855, partial [Acidobacteriota bacterium]|nr:hypothetical protein [Acidobacteriota bacterium]